MCLKESHTMKSYPVLKHHAIKLYGGEEVYLHSTLDEGMKRLSSGQDATAGFCKHESLGSITKPFNQFNYSRKAMGQYTFIQVVLCYHVIQCPPPIPLHTKLSLTVERKVNVLRLFH